MKVKIGSKSSSTAATIHIISLCLHALVGLVEHTLQAMERDGSMMGPSSEVSWSHRWRTATNWAGDTELCYVLCR